MIDQTEIERSCDVLLLIVRQSLTYTACLSVTKRGVRRDFPCTSFGIFLFIFLFSKRALLSHYMFQSITTEMENHLVPADGWISDDSDFHGKSKSSIPIQSQLKRIPSHCIPSGYIPSI